MFSQTLFKSLSLFTIFHYNYEKLINITTPTHRTSNENFVYKNYSRRCELYLDNCLRGKITKLMVFAYILVVGCWYYTGWRWKVDSL